MIATAGLSMVSASSIPYHLRLNKAVEREIFISFLAVLYPCLQLSDYQYIGMGGPFLEEYRAMHARLGLRKMVCVESDENTYKRQLFNMPFGGIECINSTVEDYLQTKDLSNNSVLIWLDYSDPSNHRTQIETFMNLVWNVGSRSILKLTLNADAAELVKSNGLSGNELFNRRLMKVQSQLGSLLAPDATADEISYRGFGRLLLRSIKYSLDKALEGTGVSFIGISSYSYSDGQPMVTLTGVSVDDGDVESFLAETKVSQWPFYSQDWTIPEKIDLPVLSTQERIELQRAMNSSKIPQLGYSLPEGRLLKNTKEMLSSFERFYRVTPAYAKVDI
jgi:hypothetical protein